jgi:hypothetical protein
MYEKDPFNTIIASMSRSPKWEISRLPETLTNIENFNFFCSSNSHKRTFNIHTITLKVCHTKNSQQQSWTQNKDKKVKQSNYKPGNHLLEAEATETIMSMKNSNDTIGNRTRNVPACSAVPQPTAPPRAPGHKIKTNKIGDIIFIEGDGALSRSFCYPNTIFSFRLRNLSQQTMQLRNSKRPNHCSIIIICGVKETSLE